MSSLKYKILIITPLIVFLLCSNALPQNYKIHNGDTINRIDINNKKQGLWIVFSKTDPSKKIAEGEYQDNRKTGLWKEWYPSGQLKQEITYVNNRPNGFAKFYYENGKVSEQGVWEGNKWVGEYKYYYKNGQPAYEWKYNERGKRTGEQKYYYENGNVMIEGEWEDGKESGVIKEYWPNGKMRATKEFRDGEFKPESVKIFNEQGIEIDKKDIAEETTHNSSGEPDNTNNTALESLPDGFHKTFTKDNKLETEGEYESGRLKNGKRYFYGPGGKVIKMVIYENFKVKDTKYR